MLRRWFRAGESAPGQRRRRFFRFLRRKPSAARHAELLKSLQSHQKTIEILKQRQEELESRQLTLSDEIAEKLAKGCKEAAAQTLRRRRLLQREISQLDSSRLKLETMIFNIESALTQLNFFGALHDLSDKQSFVMKAW